MDSILRKDLVHGGLYKLESKKYRIGVYDITRNGFMVIWRRYGTLILDYTAHYEEKFGSAKPLEFVMMCPVENLGELIFHEKWNPCENAALQEFLEWEQVQLGWDRV